MFFAALGAWAALWFVGQIGWAYDELFAATPLPWFKWHIILQLCGSALPLIALVAWPHRDNVAETSITVALDIIVLVFLTGFLYWSLIIAPGTAPEQSPLALRMLAIIGPLVRLSAVIGLVLAARSAGKGPWAAVYQRMAIGLGLAFLLLVFLGFVTVSGNYGTGAIPDIGWMLPFFFAASAIAIAPPLASRCQHDKLRTDRSAVDRAIAEPVGPRGARRRDRHRDEAAAAVRGARLAHRSDRRTDRDAPRRAAR